MRFFPPDWWRLDLARTHPHIWDAAEAASPQWIIWTLVILVISTILGTARFSIFCIVGHAIVAIDSLCRLPEISLRHGWHWWPVGDLPMLHAVWINLLFAGLHWLNVTRAAEEVLEPPKNETGSSP